MTDVEDNLVCEEDGGAEVMCVDVRRRRGDDGWRAHTVEAMVRDGHRQADVLFEMARDGEFLRLSDVDVRSVGFVGAAEMVEVGARVVRDATGLSVEPPAKTLMDAMEDVDV